MEFYEFAFKIAESEDENKFLKVVLKFYNVFYVESIKITP